jgi:hypothetical protein
MKLQTDDDDCQSDLMFLDTDMFISRFSLQEREYFLAYSITFLREITFQYICLSRV